MKLPSWTVVFPLTGLTLILAGCPGLTTGDLFGTGGAGGTSSGTAGHGGATTTSGSTTGSTTSATTGSTTSATTGSTTSATTSTGAGGCTGGLVSCGGTCVNLDTDPQHCGDCTIACDPGLACNQGNCECPAGTMDCGDGTCTPVTSDVDNCGSCGNQCPLGGTCQNGHCQCSATTCSSPLEDLCTTLQNTPSDCGSCGNACDDDQACIGGHCSCRFGLAQCSGNCVDTKHDWQNCGSCGNQCNTNTQRCVDGQCKTTLCSQIGQTVCNFGCYTQMAFQRDPLNCGGCGNTCATDEVCAAGQCQQYYPAPSCTGCPCAACGASTTCCPQVGAAFCTFGSACPG